MHEFTPDRKVSLKMCPSHWDKLENIADRAHMHVHDLIRMILYGFNKAFYESDIQQISNVYQEVDDATKSYKKGANHHGRKPH